MPKGWARHKRSGGVVRVNRATRSAADGWSRHTLPALCAHNLFLPPPPAAAAPHRTPTTTTRAPEEGGGWRTDLLVQPVVSHPMDVGQAVVGGDGGVVAAGGQVHLSCLAQYAVGDGEGQA